MFDLLRRALFGGTPAAAGGTQPEAAPAPTLPAPMATGAPVPPGMATEIFGHYAEPAGEASSDTLNLRVQMAMEQYKRAIEMTSNIVKAHHDVQMTAVNNTRG